MSLQHCGLARFAGPLHQGNVISLLGLGPGQVSSSLRAVCVCARAPELGADTVMDGEDEQINTKGLSLWLHPNLPRLVRAVSLQAEMEKRRENEGNNDKAIGRLRGVDDS